MVSSTECFIVSCGKEPTHNIMFSHYTLGAQTTKLSDQSNRCTKKPTKNLLFWEQWLFSKINYSFSYFFVILALNSLLLWFLDNLCYLVVWLVFIFVFFFNTYVTRRLAGNTFFFFFFIFFSLYLQSPSVYESKKKNHSFVESMLAFHHPQASQSS